jgi:hypothetical protein
LRQAVLELLLIVIFSFSAENIEEIESSPNDTNHLFFIIGGPLFSEDLWIGYSAGIGVLRLLASLVAQDDKNN